MPITYQEFLNQNSHRRYPLKDEASARDVTDVFTIPDSLMVNMQLCAPTGALAGGLFFVSSVVVRRYTVDVTISYKPTSDLPFVVGSFFNIDTTGGTNIDYVFVPLPQAQITDQLYYDMTGSITIGSPEASVLTPGAWEFDYTATELNAGIINEGLTQVRSIQVGTNRFYNNVILKEGNNVTLTPLYDAATNTTTITFSARLTQSAGTLTLENDEDIINAMLEIYGLPITSINTVAASYLPDSYGNFNLIAEDCIAFENVSNALKLNNPCSTPCCDNALYLGAVYDAINQMNVRYARIIEFYNAASVNIGTIQQKLGLLEAQTGYF
jgi:hypothetical protein